jgi:hypothetical protein
VLHDVAIGADGRRFETTTSTRKRINASVVERATRIELA